jgi:ketosteroid isomerase-like protein
MKNILFIVFVFLSGSLSAQPEQKVINDQVWKPFIKTFNDFDDNGFMALHSKDVVRALRDDGRVMGYDEYAAIEASDNHTAKLNKSTRKIELRFTERWINQNLAYEVGVYKTESIKPSGNNRVYYGKFHVVLRKENGTWKILVDSDSNEGGITDKEFLAARPME